MRTFDNVRFLLYWNFFQSVWREKPKALRGMNPAEEKNPGSNTTIQDAEEVWQTRTVINSALQVLTNEEKALLQHWYGRERTRSQLADLILGDEFKRDYQTRMKMRVIEEKLEPEFARLGLLGEKKYEQAQRYQHQAKWLDGLKDILKYVSRSIMWFQQAGCKNKEFMDCLHKVGHKWKAHTDDLDRWIRSH